MSTSELAFLHRWYTVYAVTATNTNVATDMTVKNAVATRPSRSSSSVGMSVNAYTVHVIVVKMMNISKKWFKDRNVQQCAQSHTNRCISRA